MNLIDKVSNLPEIILSDFLKYDPNEDIDIYDGPFELGIDSELINVSGRIYYSWFPYQSSNFYCKLEGEQDILSPTVLGGLKVEVIRDGMKMSDAFITNIENTYIRGRLIGEVVSGDKSISVSKAKFVIPNFRDFLGDPVKQTLDHKIVSLLNRLVLENQEFLLTIDKSPNFNNLKERLKLSGGYCLLFSCSLEKKESNLSYQDVVRFNRCLSKFLSFYCGDRATPMLVEGVFEEEVKWVDYSGYKSSAYQKVNSWAPAHSIEALNEFWCSFYDYYRNEDNQRFISSIIHWYIEANTNSGYIEGSVISCQVALELIYNWMLVEQEPLLMGRDTLNISASNKIRLLLSKIGLTSSAPTAFSELQSYVEDNNDLPDAVEAFVQFRNALVHGNQDKRRRLVEIPIGVKIELQQLGLWYIEVSLLKIWGYKGKYCNRCSGSTWAGDGEEIMPYLITPNK